ncbi:MAG: histidine kinase [Dehalococcoidia bacterium]
MNALERALVATRRAPARALDLALIVGLGVLYALEVRPPWDSAPLVLGPYAQPDALAALLVAGALAPLWVRRTHPGWAAAGTLGAAYTFRALEYPAVAAVDLAALVAIYALGAHAARGRLVAPPAVAAWLFVTMVVAPEPVHFATLIVQLVVFEGAWALGTMARLQRAQAASMVEAARQRERVHIAAELHDSMAHHLTVAVLQAEAASLAVDSEPEAARRALGAVREAARSALAEARRAVGVLGTSSGASAPRAPAPSLASLDDLVDRLRASGLDVSVTNDIEPSRLHGALDAAAYRIVQEALTNAARHAAGAPASLRLVIEDGALVIEVANDAGTRLAALPAAGGRGIEGMRERTIALGGTFEAGSRPDGGFAVRVRLPLEAVPA